MQRPANLKVGDKFVVIGDSYCANKGDIVTLDEDDNSNCPFFTGSTKPEYGHHKRVCISFDSLRPATTVTKFGGRIDGNTVTVHIGKAAGTAKYNPDDEKHGMPFKRYIGVALAFARADGMSEADVDKLAEALIHAFDKPEAEDAPKQEDFKVGETVRIVSDLKDDYCISHDTLRAMNGKTAMIKSVEVENGACHLENSDYIWPARMLHHVSHDAHSVIIDGVRYAPEK